MSARPRYFIDFTVPHREDGSALTTCSEPGDYEVYVHWLADYLHGACLPISPLQQAWLELFQGSPMDLIFYCSESFGNDADWLNGVDNHIKEGTSYQEFKDLMEPHWRECNQDFDSPEDQWTFEEFLGITEAAYNARKVELESMGDEIPYWSHVDIPFRSILCHALRSIPSHDARFLEMDFYFRNFTDNANK